MKRIDRDHLLDPRRLAACLDAICPGFASDDVLKDLAESKHGLHNVMYNFVEYFSANHHALSDKQVQQLAYVLNDAVSVDDDLENAVSTCLLEHLWQIRADKLLWPYLSSVAKRKTRA